MCFWPVLPAKRNKRKRHQPRGNAGFYATGREYELIWLTDDAPNRKLALIADEFPYDKFK